MGSVKKGRLRPLAALLALLALSAGCNGVGEDLAPSGTDRRPPVEAGTTGPAVGQNAPGFTLPATSGDNVSLSAALAGRKAVVLYFTMWCPICDAHMSNMRSAVMPAFPDVSFLAIDYVSGSAADALRSQTENGYTDFMVLVDIGNPVLNAYSATMGTTVVVDNTGVIRMNEDYGTGSRLQAVLGGLP